MSIIPESNYVDVKFDYKSGSQSIGSVPMMVLFCDSTNLSADVLIKSKAEKPVGVSDGVSSAVDLYFDNGGQELLLYPYDTDSGAETAVKSCLAEYPNFIYCAFEKTISQELGAVLQALDDKENEYRGFLLYATPLTKSQISQNIGDNTNIALLWLPTSITGDKTYSAILLGAKMSQFDANVANGIHSLQFSQFVGISDNDEVVFNGTKTDLNTRISEGYNVIVNLGGRAIVLDGAKLINGEPLHAKWATSIIETWLTQALTDELIKGLPYSAMSDGVLYNVVDGILTQFVTNGAVNKETTYSGVEQIISYNGKAYKTISEDEVLENGYKIYQISIGDASTVDRQALRTPPIYIYCIIANSIRQIVVKGEVRS